MAEEIKVVFSYDGPQGQDRGESLPTGATQPSSSQPLGETELAQLLGEVLQSMKDEQTARRAAASEPVTPSAESVPSREVPAPILEAVEHGVIKPEDVESVAALWAQVAANDLQRALQSQLRQQLAASSAVGVEQPEVREVGEPEAREVVQPEVREVREVIQPEVPEVREVIQPEVREVIQPEVREVIQPEVHEVIQPEVHEVREVIQPEVREVIQPEVREVIQSEAHEVTDTSGAVQDDGNWREELLDVNVPEIVESVEPRRKRPVTDVESDEEPLVAEIVNEDDEFVPAVLADVGGAGSAGGGAGGGGTGGTGGTGGDGDGGDGGDDGKTSAADAVDDMINVVESLFGMAAPVAVPAMAISAVRFLNGLLATIGETAVSVLRDYAVKGVGLMTAEADIGGFAQGTAQAAAGAVDTWRTIVDPFGLNPILTPALRTVSAAFTALGDTVAVVDQGMESLIGTMSQWSGAVAMGQAQAEILTIMAQLRRSQAIGGEVGEIAMQRGEIEAKLIDLQTEMLREFLPLVKDILKDVSSLVDQFGDAGPALVASLVQLIEICRGIAGSTGVAMAPSFINGVLGGLGLIAANTSPKVEDEWNASLREELNAFLTPSGERGGSGGLLGRRGGRKPPEGMF